MANQFAKRPEGGHFVTMSAGNYGKTFAYALKHYGSKGKVVMPETAPLSRVTLIQVSDHLSSHSNLPRPQIGCFLQALVNIFTSSESWSRGGESPHLQFDGCGEPLHSGRKHDLPALL